MAIPMIAGLYPYARGGVVHPPVVTLREIPACLDVNPSYRDRLVVLAGDEPSADHLRSFGLEVRRVFEDAPPSVRRDAAHKMKHWMCRWALTEFGEFLWVDWDTVCVRPPDEAWESLVRGSDTPRFIRIPNYWATVNCGVYYAPSSWASAMDASFDAEVSEPNDELLWRSVLPPNVVDRPEFWWGERAVHVERPQDIGLVTTETYFAHVKRLEWAPSIRRAAGVPA
ncbi:MAG: hypothetical protein ABMB14_15830 [Myxococcota bacterium]